MLGFSGSGLLQGSSVDGGGGGGGSTAATTTTSSTASAQQEGSAGATEMAATSSVMGGVEGNHVTTESKGEELMGVGERGLLGGGGGGGGGNRWPRQETLALLKIRSDMDVVFRDSSLKGPLWEEVSRKMAELGYHRSAKKCREKFENVYKYHKRTKEGRAGKADGKTYRFFDQLEALEAGHLPTSSSLPPPPPPPPLPPPSVLSHDEDVVPVSMAPPMPQPVVTSHQVSSTVPSIQSPTPISQATPLRAHHHQLSPTTHPPLHQITMPIHHQPIPSSLPNTSNFARSPSSGTLSSSSSTSSDEEIQGMRRKRKRKWKDFFEKLMREVIHKQEDLQRKFLEAVEKREHDRATREEAWKVQEAARLNREHDILLHERSMAAAKDAALISFLQKLSDQQQIPIPPPVIQVCQSQISQYRPPNPVQPQPPPPAPAPAPVSHAQELHINPVIPTTTAQLPQPQPQAPQMQLTSQPTSSVQVAPATRSIDMAARTNNGDPSGESLVPMTSSSRWPRTEVQALIKLRTSMDQKYRESGPKGPLWEEISASMRQLGYNRSSKRCKEKWENINKYFKKVKESNKKRPEDSKTCPYFHQLDAIYRERSNAVNVNITTTSTSSQPPAGPNEGSPMAPPIMAQPEQQWLFAPPRHDHDPGSDNIDPDRDDEDEEEDDEDDQDGGYEIVANNSNNNNNNNNASSMGGAATAAAAAAAVDNR